MPDGETEAQRGDQGHAAVQGSKESKQLYWTSCDFLSFPQQPDQGGVVGSVPQQGKPRHREAEYPA